MALITPPAALPIKRIQWALRQPHQVNRSGWTGRRQVLTTPGASFWSCSGEFKPIRGHVEARRWIAFFQSLEGQVHKFPVIAVEAKQHGWVNPTVSSGAAGAKTLVLSSGDTRLTAGMKMTVPLSDGTFQLVTLTANLNGTTATFIPALRNSVAISQPVETILPYAHVALTNDTFQYAVDQGQMYSFSFDADEAF